MSEHLKVHNKPSTIDGFERIVRAEIIPRLGRIKVSDLSRSDVKAFHHGLKDRPYWANRCLAVLRKMLSLAVNDWELRADNPALGLTAFPERRRERYASDEDEFLASLPMLSFSDALRNRDLKFRRERCGVGHGYYPSWSIAVE